MSKIGPILKDGFILFAAATGFVFLTNLAFSSLEKNKPTDDPIVTAIFQDDANTVERLSAYGPDATNRSDELGRTALMRLAYVDYSSAERAAAADKTRAGMIHWLVQNGARINARDRDDWTPLMWASWSGMPTVAEKFLDSGAVPNAADKRGNTPLILAAEMGHPDLVKLLLARGAAKAAANNSHLTALEAALNGLKSNPRNRAAYEQIIVMLGS